jgi:hypothetical protein
LPYSLPGWIKGPEDPAHAFISAYQAGAQVAGQQARLQMEANQQATHFAVQQQQLQQQNLRQQQQLEMQKAYHEATIGLREQALGVQQQRLAQTAEVAARRYAGQQAYQKDLDEGYEPEEAALRHPELFPSMAGFGSTAKEFYERSHPFQPYDVKTASGIPMVMKSRGQAAFLPKVSLTGDIQSGRVLDEKGNPIRGMIAVGGYARNIPKVVDPNKAELKALLKDNPTYADYLTGAREVPEKMDANNRKKLAGLKSQYDALKQASSPAAPAASTQDGGTVLMKNKKGDTVRVPKERVDWATQNGYSLQ